MSSKRKGKGAKPVEPVSDGDDDDGLSDLISAFGGGQPAGKAKPAASPQQAKSKPKPKPSPQQQQPAQAKSKPKPKPAPQQPQQQQSQGSGSGKGRGKKKQAAQNQGGDDGWTTVLNKKKAGAGDGTCFIGELPQAITRNILGHTPEHTHVVCKFVCKSWYNTLSGSKVDTVKFLEGICHSGQLRVLKWAISKGCPWEKIKDRFIALAAVGGSIELMEWGLLKGCPWGNTAPLAAGAGRIWELDWAKAHNCPMQPGIGGLLSMSVAAEAGQLRALKWMNRFYKEIQNKKVQLEAQQRLLWEKDINTVCYAAAAGGHLGLLQWARKVGFPWDEKVCLRAASEAHFHVLRWAIENGCPCNFLETITHAAEANTLDTMKWLQAFANSDEEEKKPESENPVSEKKEGEEEEKGEKKEGEGGESQPSSEKKEEASSSEKKEGEEEKGEKKEGEEEKKKKEPIPVGDLELCRIAAWTGNLDMLNWAREQGCKLTTDCFDAARSIEMLKALKEAECPWSASACASAAAEGNLEKLKWLREAGCPWDENTTVKAKDAGHTDLYNWAKENGCP